MKLPTSFDICILTSVYARKCSSYSNFVYHLIIWVFYIVDDYLFQFDMWKNT